MNLFKKLFKFKKNYIRIVESDDLDDLVCALGKSKEFVKSLYSPNPKYQGYEHLAEGELSTIELKKGVLFNLDVHDYFSHDPDTISKEYKLQPNEKHQIRKIIPYEQIEKSPILKKYVKSKSLESSLAVLSIASVLASTFFLAGNITGNAILINNANSSGIIGAGLFVLGVASFFVAKNI